MRDRGEPVVERDTRAMWTTVLCASVMLIGAVTSYIAWHFMRQSALFELQAIESEGHKRTSHEEIVRYMSPNYAAAGASAGENIFTIDIDMLRASILRHPWVKDAEVQRIVPGTLAVRIVEHEARAVVALGALYYVDEDGEPFSRASVQEIGDLPVLSGLDAALYEEDRVTWARFIKLGVAFAEAAKKGTLAVGEIQLDPALGVVAHLLPSGTTASFGTGDFAAKVQRLKDVRALLAQRGQSADSYLLDNPRRPDAVVARLSGQKAQKAPLIVSAR